MKLTSIESHQKFIPHKENMHKKILKGLYKIQRGSFRDISKASNLKESQVWKRLSELEKTGLIRDTMETKICPETNRRVTMWELKNP